MALTKRPVVLIIRDGWGHNPYPQWNHANAIFMAKHPVQDKLLADYPCVQIHTSGFEVGLPEGTMGNSEVGHQNIGAGRIVDQESVRITKQCRNGEFLDNKTLNEAVEHALNNKTSLHLFGLVSDAGVHSLLEHLYGCLELAKKKGLSKVFLHAFTDGRDTPPNSGINFIRQIEAKMKEIGAGKIASVIGRYWAMDRDNRWNRVEKAFNALVNAAGSKFATAEQAVTAYYEKPLESNMSGDEFIMPSIMVDASGNPLATVKDGDSVIFFNYRGDRPREITKAFVMDKFEGFSRGEKIKDLFYATMTAYEEGLPVKVAYPKPPKMINTLGDFLSKNNLKQFRCAETEKFPHVTFFFNDYREEPFPGEDRKLVPSPKVSTYDLQPEMSAYGVADEVVKAVNAQAYDFICVNFANGDMVGHSGILAAAVKAVEHVDICVGKVLAAVEKVGGCAMITADHGNCEQMVDPTTNGPHTAHTTYDVDFIMMDKRFQGKKLREGGRLSDVAPTILQLMNLQQPREMNGKTLIPA